MNNNDRIIQLTEALMAIYNYTIWQDRTDSEKLDKIQDICQKVLEYKNTKNCSVQ